MLKLRCVAYCCLLPVLIGCGRASSDMQSGSVNGTPDSTITITGSSTLAPMVSEIAARYEQRNPDVRIDVQTGGSSRGIHDVHNGTAHIGMASRNLKPEESQGVSSTTIAWDGVAFVVHAENPVEQLSTEQLRSVYLGTVENWSEVGGVDGPIVASSRAEGRSELDLMSEYLGIVPSEIKADVIDGETQQTIKTISSNRNAIVYTSIGAAQHAIDDGLPLKLLSLERIEPSTESVQSGDFPLARPLVLITPDDQASPLIKDFIKFALAPDMDDIASGLGYVPASR